MSKYCRLAKKNLVTAVVALLSSVLTIELSFSFRSFYFLNFKKFLLHISNSGHFSGC